MRSLFRLLIVFGAVLLPASSSTQPDLRAELVHHARRFGLGEPQGVWSGTLAPGQHASVWVPLQAGVGYAILAVCDARCKDVDTYLYLGALIDQDIEPDKYPLIRLIPQFNTRYRLEVRMEDCAASHCTYAVGVFSVIG